jgi:hypothetical protein
LLDRGCGHASTAEVWSHSGQYSPRLAAQASRSCSQAGSSLQYTHTFEPSALCTGFVLHRRQYQASPMGCRIAFIRTREMPSLDFVPAAPFDAAPRTVFTLGTVTASTGRAGNALLLAGRSVLAQTSMSKPELAHPLHGQHDIGNRMEAVATKRIDSFFDPIDQDTDRPEKARKPGSVLKRNSPFPRGANMTSYARPIRRISIRPTLGVMADLRAGWRCRRRDIRDRPAR